MTDMPGAFTEYDWLELVAFSQKADREGFDYTFENHPPRFRDPEMQAIGSSPDQLRAVHDAQLPEMNRWWEIEDGNAVDLLNAHSAEADGPV